MGISKRHAILFLLVVSFFAIYPPHAGGCGPGPCSLGGTYDFLGDPAVSIDMPGYDEFVRDNLGNNQPTLSTKSVSQKAPINNSSPINQTISGNLSQNSSEALHVINDPGNMTSANTTSANTPVKLGASGTQDKRLTTLALTTFNSNMF